MNFTDFYKFNMNFVMLWACFWFFFFFSSIYIFVKCHLHLSLSEAKMRSQNWEFSFCILILNFATNCGKCFLHQSQGQWLLSSPFFFFHFDLYSLYSVFNLYLLILHGIPGFDMLTLEFISRLSKLLWIWNNILK